MRNHRITPTLAAVLLSVAVLLTLGACATTQSPGQQVDDATITAKVKTKLTADPQVNPFNIDVDTDDGVVTLRGRVEDAEAKVAAEQLARDTSGVRGVRNEIRVGQRVGSETPASDQALAAVIETKFAADPEVSTLNIDVDVQDGVVTLSGWVKSEAARQKAHDIAHSVNGVDTVYFDQLKVRAGR